MLHHLTAAFRLYALRLSANLLFLVVLPALATAARAEDNAARILVQVPADARLYFDDQLTQQTGENRTFATPPLPAGATYRYQLRAEVTRDGVTLTQTQRVTVRAGGIVPVDFRRLALAVGSPSPSRAAAPPAIDTDWPRLLPAEDYVLTVYQPRFEAWDGDRLTARAVVAAEKRVSPQPVFGMVALSAHTEVDRERRQVRLSDVRVTRATFPTASDQAGAYEQTVQEGLAPGMRTIGLDALQSSLAVSRAMARTGTVAVKNDPPRIVTSTRPALLVLIDGEPVQRQVEGSSLLRIINTRALLVLDPPGGAYYLRLQDRWLQSDELDGTWKEVPRLPAPVAPVLEELASDPQANQLDNLAGHVREALAQGITPSVTVSTVPAELIETAGPPELAPIDGTELLWVKNSTTPLLFDTTDRYFYALLSGRWFRAKALEGPWEFVAADRLPADFARIPATHPRGDVLSAVAGTPQAREAGIANQVPRTALINRREARLDPVYDGPPQFQPIDGTPLQYAVNSPTPVLRVSSDNYYAVENGVWFTAAAPDGPWATAAAVPDVVYTIPPSSPINYVTYCYVYGATPDAVYAGYTPGYLGTCVCPQDVVVYGTGWASRPWIGRSWVGRSWTYGWGARFTGSPGYQGIGLAAASGRPWWGPIGWRATWGGSWWQTDGPGASAAVPLNNLSLAQVNVYRRWPGAMLVSNVRPTTTDPRRRLGTSAAAASGFGSTAGGFDGGVYPRGGGLTGATFDSGPLSQTSNYGPGQPLSIGSSLPGLAGGGYAAGFGQAFVPPIRPATVSVPAVTPYRAGMSPAGVQPGPRPFGPGHPLPTGPLGVTPSRH